MRQNDRAPSGSSPLGETARSPDRSDLTGQALWALALFGVGFGAYWLAMTMTLQQAHDPLGGRFIPVLISVSLIVSAIAVLLRIGMSAFFRRHATVTVTDGVADTDRGVTDGPSAESFWQRPNGRVLTMLLTAIVFITIMDQYRFVPGAVVGMAGAMMLLGERRPSRVIIVPVVTAIVVFFIFTRLLLVRLP